MLDAINRFYIAEILVILGFFGLAIGHIFGKMETGAYLAFFSLGSLFLLNLLKIFAQIINKTRRKHDR